MRNNLIICLSDPVILRWLCCFPAQVAGCSKIMTKRSNICPKIKCQFFNLYFNISSRFISMFYLYCLNARPSIVLTMDILIEHKFESPLLPQTNFRMLNNRPIELILFDTFDSLSRQSYRLFYASNFWCEPCVTLQTMVFFKVNIPDSSRIQLFWSFLESNCVITTMISCHYDTDNYCQR